MRPGAVPSLLPNCPTYLNNSQPTREAPLEKKSRIEAETLKQAILESTITAREQNEKFNFSNLNELKLKLDYVTLCNNWHVISKPNCVVFFYINFNSVPHDILYVTVNNELGVNVFLKGVDIKIKSVPKFVSNVVQLDQIITLSEKFLKGEEHNTLVADTICNLLDLLKVNEDKLKTIDFLKTQIHLCVQSKGHHKFDSEIMIISSMVLFISPHAYKFLRSFGIIVLPHPNTLKNLCSNVNVDPNSSDFLSYIKVKRNSLQSHESYVTLMLDEIHIKPYMDYKGGNLVGSAYDSQNLASTAHVFMIQSLLSPFKDVVHILPANKMDALKLFEILEKVVLGLQSSGFQVVAIVTDNNKINNKAVSNFAKLPNQSDIEVKQKTKTPKNERSIVYPNPADKSKPLFYLNDSVHIFKCIRNNWLNLKTYRKTFCYPDFENNDILRYASFEAIREVYKLETEKLLKFGYGLSLKALWPSTFERQNVKLVTQIFNDNVENSLLELGQSNNIENYEDTAKFINIIKRWWDVVNVKTPLKGLRLRNEMQKPLTDDENDERRIFLNKLYMWLEAWESLPNDGKLTTETHDAFKFTTYALLEMTSYCVTELNMTYLLPGKVQTDSLEDRFGRYRQLSGSQYHVSLRQIFESEKKLRLLSILDLSVKAGSSNRIIIKKLDDATETANAPSDETVILNNYLFQQIDVSDQDLNAIESDIPVLTYITGYCCYSIIKKIKCNDCKEFLTVDREMACESSQRLIFQRDRGGLRFPRKSALLIVMYSFVILQKLLGNETFLKLKNQRATACKIILKKILDYNITTDSSCSQHSSTDLWNKIVFITVNIVLNNYCKVTNNNALETVYNARQTNKRKKDRKLQTVSDKPKPSTSSLKKLKPNY